MIWHMVVAFYSTTKVDWDFFLKKCTKKIDTSHLNRPDFFYFLFIKINALFPEK